MSAVKYHVNPDTGRVGQCKAVHQCRFGEHYDTEAEARAGYEKQMNEANIGFGSLKKESVEKKFPLVNKSTDGAMSVSGMSAYNLHPPVEIHPQVEVNRFGESFTVDEEIHPLLESLWGTGLSTLFSCQGDEINPKKPKRRFNKFRPTPASELAYILFEQTPRMNDFQSFLQKNSVEWESSELIRLGSIDEIKFSKGTGALYIIEVEDFISPSGVSRTCLRFPKYDIPNLVDLVSDFRKTA